MKVRITSTPEFPDAQLKEIVSLLKKTPGELDFVYNEALSQEMISLFNKKFKDPGNLTTFTSEELFYTIQSIRIIQKISNDDFIVLISSFKNESDWFSAFERRNIFIISTVWDEMTEADPKYGISFQIVENIFQSLLELDIENPDNEPNLHSPPIGCINDVCDDEIEILKKLRIADICKSCITRAYDKNVNENIIIHVKKIIETFISEFKFSKGIKSPTSIEKVIIDNNGNIKIGQINIDLDPLPKVIFIFLLKNHRAAKIAQQIRHTENQDVAGEGA